MASNVDRLVNVGTPPEQAVEIVRQIDTAGGKVTEFTNGATQNTTLTAQDSGSVFVSRGTGALTFTFPAGLPLGFYIEVCMLGAASVTLVAGAGATLQGDTSTFSETNTYIIVQSIGENEFFIRSIP